MDIDRQKLTCHHCGRFGHLSKDCQRRLGLCLQCRKAGHISKNCVGGNTQNVRRISEADRPDKAVTVLKEETDIDSEEEPEQGFVGDS